MSDGAPGNKVENTATFGNYLMHGIDEIILPEAVSWWPAAPGWQVLAVLLIALLAWQAIRVARRWWRNRYRREALRRIDQYSKEKTLYDTVAVLPVLLKATALQSYPRQQVASLSGREWLLFLDKHYAGPAFSAGTGEKLLAIAYLPREQWQLDDDESRALIKMARRWITTHQEVQHV